jgi:hypothetical protein
MAGPVGETDRGALRLDFDRRLMLQFRGSTITSDAGLLPYRELDDAIGLTDTGADRLADARTGKNGRHRLAGYEDVNDAERLCRDPAVRWAVGDQAITGSAAAASQMGRFETAWLTGPITSPLWPICPASGSTRCTNDDRRGSSCSTWIRAKARPGEQEGSAYNGHFGCTCYHPLFVFNQLGDVERCALRPGNGSQRRGLVHGVGAGSRPLSGHREAFLFSRRRGFRQSRAVRVP